MEKTLKFHRGEKGYFTHININGEPINYKINKFPPKYNSLLLKGVINLLTIDKSMYNDPELIDLFKDR